MITPLVTKNRIRAGMMLLEDGTGTPESFVLNIEPYSMGWSFIIDATAAQLGKDLEGAGWTFFYLAGAIHVSGFGLNDQSRTDRAMAQLIHAVKLQQFNCLEITQVTRASFLGLPYTKVAGHARHIQRSRILSDPRKNAPSLPRGASGDPPSMLGRKARSVREAIHRWENEGGVTC
ncbi:MAG TPA: hypothetical protein VGK64_21475 [Bryobacteraceae bacterium]